MREIDLGKLDIRTDLIIDSFVDKKYINKIDYKKSTYYKNIIVEEIFINKRYSKIFNKKEGLYKSISFEDITDNTNYNNVLDVFIEVFSKFLDEINLSCKNKCLIVGLGNRNSTPDAVGPKSLDNIVVTHHILAVDGSLEDGYGDVSILEPGVFGVTGVDSSLHIKGLVDLIKPDYLIIIDALKTSSIDRLVKTIQISNSGIIPGSGVNNDREEIDDITTNIPVIAIGIPTIIDSATIVYDTLFYLIQKTSSKKLSKKRILGLVGELDENDLRTLIKEILDPVNHNLMVTPKEIDFLIDKISLLISEGINNSVHKIIRQD